MGQIYIITINQTIWMCKTCLANVLVWYKSQLNPLIYLFYIINLYDCFSWLLDIMIIETALTKINPNLYVIFSIDDF